ncbi:hypothetical protein C8R44DRAFT_869730 [Mycena epipterygia]|nr:hypothetical protein C8R44DRAFT_869730 [Mycena epipterygia]
MDASKPIVFYDIASAPPATPFAVNPCKTRYALNFKRVHYRTEWVDLPDVASVRKKLNVAPVRKFRDGSSYHTLPIIEDPSTGEVIGDSFDIAVYLDKTFPDAPPLLPPSTTALQAAFNTHVDNTFNPFNAILLFHGIPFNPGTAEASKVSICWRMEKERWEDITVEGEERVQTLEAFKAALGELAKWYGYSDGPFMEGENPLYADFILGAWLRYMSVAMPVKEWEDVQTWQDGLWGRLHRALEKYAEVK